MYSWHSPAAPFHLMSLLHLQRPSLASQTEFMSASRWHQRSPPPPEQLKPRRKSGSDRRDRKNCFLPRERRNIDYIRRIG